MLDEEKLIQCVRKYDFLYNCVHPKYMDSAKKEAAWKDISEQMKQPMAACKQKWQCLRDAYRRALNKRKTKTGTASRIIKKWKYEDEMSFVAPYFIKGKAMIDSVDLASDDDESTSNNEPNESIQNPYSVSPISQSQNQYSNHDNWPNDAVEAEMADCDSQNKNDNAAQDNNSDDDEPKKENKKKAKIQPVLSASAVLMARLLDEQSLPSQREHDDMDRFFLNLSDTVKKFPPYLQALAKNKIFNMVSEMELQQFAPPGSGTAFVKSSPSQY